MARDDLRIDGEPRRYDASPRARRGFCPTCGAFLFWEEHGTDEIGVFAMEGAGLTEVPNPSALFLTNRSEAGSGQQAASGTHAAQCHQHGDQD